MSFFLQVGNLHYQISYFLPHEYIIIPDITCCFGIVLSHLLLFIQKKLPMLFSRNIVSSSVKYIKKSSGATLNGTKIYTYIIQNIAIPSPIDELR